MPRSRSPLNDDDDDEDTGAVFIGSRNKVEDKFQPVVDILQTVTRPLRSLSNFSSNLLLQDTTPSRQRSSAAGPSKLSSIHSPGVSAPDVTSVELETILAPVDLSQTSNLEDTSHGQPVQPSMETPKASSLQSSVEHKHATSPSDIPHHTQVLTPSRQGNTCLSPSKPNKEPSTPQTVVKSALGMTDSPGQALEAVANTSQDLISFGTEPQTPDASGSTPAQLERLSPDSEGEILDLLAPTPCTTSTFSRPTLTTPIEPTVHTVKIARVAVPTAQEQPEANLRSHKRPRDVIQPHPLANSEGSILREPKASSSSISPVISGVIPDQTEDEAATLKDAALAHLDATESVVVTSEPQPSVIPPKVEKYSPPKLPPGAETDQEGATRGRKRQKLSPDRTRNPDSNERLKSLSPESADVLQTLVIPSPSRTRTPSPSRPRKLSPNGDVFSTPATSARPPIPVGPNSPAQRVPLSASRPFFANPLDNPNRSPARRVLASIATASPSKAGRSASIEPPSSGGGIFASANPRRALSAEPSSKPLPFPISSVKPLPPLEEEAPSSPAKSSLKATTRIPRPHTKPYSRPGPSRIPPVSTAKLTNSLRQGIPETIPSRPVHSPEKGSHKLCLSPKKPAAAGVPSKQMARTVVPGMFGKSGSTNPNPPGTNSTHFSPHRIAIPPTTASDSSSSPDKDSGGSSPDIRDRETASIKETRQDLGQVHESDLVPPNVADILASTSTDGRAGPRRTGRVRKTREDEAAIGFNTVPRAVRHTEVPLQARRRGVNKNATASTLGMTDNALRALTGANTTRNQNYVIELDCQLVRREGKRPESPTTKVKTALEKRQERKSQEREDRRLRRSGEVTSSSDHEAELQAYVDKHRRGPGDDEDYETPHRPNAQSRGVKWDRALHLPPPELNGTRVREVQPPKGILSKNAKALRLDDFGNLQDVALPLTGVVQEKIVYTKVIYEDDDDGVLTPPPEPVKRSGRKKKA